MTSPEPQALYSQKTIEEEITLEAIIPRVREAFVEFARGRTQMPAKDYLLFKEHNGDLRTMSAYVDKFGLATVKLVNSHPDNPSQHNLPTVMALLSVFDPETGRPLAVMDATALTKLRTAAASSLATDQFTAGSVSTLGLIGAGGQARAQLRGQLLARNFETVRVFDLNRESSENLVDWGRQQFSGVEFIISDRLEPLVDQSEVIVSLTPGSEPLLETIESDRLVHINGMGADGPGKQEWPDSLLRRARIIVDDWEQAHHSGEIQRLAKSGKLKEPDLYTELGEALASDLKSPDRLTFFDSTGLAIQDTACARAVLDSSVAPDTTFSFLGPS